MRTKNCPEGERTEAMQHIYLLLKYNKETFLCSASLLKYNKKNSIYNIKVRKKIPQIIYNLFYYLKLKLILFLMFGKTESIEKHHTLIRKKHLMLKLKMHFYYKFFVLKNYSHE